MADRTNPAPLTLEVNSFRLILSDPQVDGGQKVKTFSVSKPEIDAMTVESVVVRLKDNLGFAELAAARSLDMATLRTGAGLTLVGLDGARNVPIRTNEQLVTFFKTIKNTKLPALEVKLLQPGIGSSGARRDPRDRVEELEADNFKMSKGIQKVEKSVRDLERTTGTVREEAQRLVSQTDRELKSKIDGTEQSLSKECANLREIAQIVQSENDTVKQLMKDLQNENFMLQEKVKQQLEEMNANMTRKIQTVQSEQNSLQQKTTEFNAGVERQSSEIQKHASELKSLDSTKLHKNDQQAALDKMNNRLMDEIATLRQSLVATEAEVKSFTMKQQSESQEGSKSLQSEVKATSDRLTAQMTALDQSVKTGLTQVKEGLVTTKAELQTMVKSEIGNLSTLTDKRLDEIKNFATKTDKDITTRVDEVTARTEATFSGLEQRMDGLVKAERSRLGNIERDLKETSAKLRSDCRGEVERVRVDYEQEAARLDADLSDLHMKHDVVKQELDFFQSRLLEQRDWSQRQFAETATATRAAQVDAQEGVAASTKMAHVLRDDQVAFRDKMAKHISLLQHSSDSYGDAINALETQRSRMRLELDAILGDHKAYVTDMDGWADDVRLKVERLFRAMEPPRCEWSITGALMKMKDLKKPLALRSPGFGLQGLRELKLELYPHGTNQSADGKAVLRMVMPPNSNVRYQCWLGKLTEGSREYESGGSLSEDLLFDSWKDQIAEDGSLKISIEILQDLTNKDESLTRAVHLEH